MKLIKILNQHRRDFQGQYECEFCKHIETDSSMNSYDDRYFHDSVIPNMKCPKCKIEMDRYDEFDRGLYIESTYFCPKCQKYIEEK